MLAIYPIATNQSLKPGIDLAQTVSLTIPEDLFPLTEKDVFIFSSISISMAQCNIAEYENQQEKSRIIENESIRYLRIIKDRKITETIHGLISENSGVLEFDEKNLILLPRDIDKAAHSLRNALKHLNGYDIPVIINGDIFRPFRQGKISIAMGISGLDTKTAICDELASAASIVTSDADSYGVLLRGIDKKYRGNGKASDLITPNNEKLFS